MRKVIFIALLAMSLLSAPSLLWAKFKTPSPNNNNKDVYYSYYYPNPEDLQHSKGPGYGIMSPYYGYGMSPTVMGPGLGPGYGYGVGFGMMGPGGGYGWGMMGPASYWQGRGQIWYAMSPKQRQTWRGMYNQYLNDTLELRQDLMEKQLELDTLVHSPNSKPDRIKASADKLVDLQAKLARAQNQFFEKWQSYFMKRVKSPAAQ
ncbi:MAG: periplasmic heavy metal sensor [Deltaproteobacteria bacterium]|nr:periplasmic heavy metal sensor [Deltaproteobacteria bacterium]